LRWYGFLSGDEHLPRPFHLSERHLRGDRDLPADHLHGGTDLRGIVLNLFAQCNLSTLSVVRRDGDLRHKQSDLRRLVNLRWLVNMPRDAGVSAATDLHSGPDLRQPHAAGDLFLPWRGDLSGEFHLPEYPDLRDDPDLCGSVGSNLFGSSDLQGFYTDLRR
jgi:hypothetical protein